MSEVVDRLLRLVDPSGAKYPMPPPPDAGVPVYPSQRYIEKNWAPEKKLRFRRSMIPSGFLLKKPPSYIMI